MQFCNLTHLYWVSVRYNEWVVQFEFDMQRGRNIMLSWQIHIISLVFWPKLYRYIHTTQHNTTRVVKEPKKKMKGLKTIYIYIWKKDEKERKKLVLSWHFHSQLYRARTRRHVPNAWAVPYTLFYIYISQHTWILFFILHV